MKIYLLLIISLCSIAVVAQQEVTINVDSGKNNNINSEQIGNNQKANIKVHKEDSSTIRNKQISADSLTMKKPPSEENSGWLTHTNTIIGLVVGLLTAVVLLFTIRTHWKKRKEL